MKNNYNVPLLLLSLFLTLIAINSCKKEKVTDPLPKYFEGEDHDQSFDVIFNGKWDHSTITWYCYRYSNKISESETREVFTKAFKRWSDVANIEFIEVFSQNDADITLGFIDDRDHWITAVNSQCPLKMKENVLAHAIPPNQTKSEDKIHEGDIHFVDNWPWTPYGTSGTTGQLSLLAVTIHEIGHSLGLEHTKDSDDIMFPMNQNLTNLSNNDVKRIINLYGAKKTSNLQISISGSCPANVKVGSSQNFVMTINNIGTSELIIDDYSIFNNTGAFSFVSGMPSFPLKVQSGKSYPVTLRFAPNYAGLHDSKFVVVSNATSGSGTSSLTGVGENSTGSCDWYLSGVSNTSTVSIYLNGSYNGPIQFSTNQINWQNDNNFYSQTVGFHTYYAKTSDCSPKSVTIEVKGSSSNIQATPSLGTYTQCNNSNPSVNGWTTNVFRIKLSNINKAPDLLEFEIIPCNPSFRISAGHKVKFEVYDAIQQKITNGYETSIFSSYYDLDYSNPAVGLSNENFSNSNNRAFCGLITISDQNNYVLARFATEFIAVSW